MSRQVRTFSNDKALVDERRKEIVRSSTKVFVKKGYDRTNVSELASALGITKGGLYHYVGSKDDILYLILNFAAERAARRIEATAVRTSSLSLTEALRLSMRMYIEDIDELQDLTNFLNHVLVNLSAQERKITFGAEARTVAFFEELLTRGINSAEFRPHDPALMAHNIVVIANAWANRRWYLRKAYTLDDYVKKQTDLVLSAIAGDAEEGRQSRSGSADGLARVVN